MHLPGGKQVVVDAKVPLASYLDALEASDEDVRDQKLADHARLVREHLQKLGAKQYWAQFADSPEYVVMFLPDEGFFRAAWEHDREIVELGVRARAARVADHADRAPAGDRARVAAGEDRRGRAAVHQLGRELYERLTVTGSHLTKVGSSLDRAVGAYNEAVGSLGAACSRPRASSARQACRRRTRSSAALARGASRRRAAGPPAAPMQLEVLPGDADAAWRARAGTPTGGAR